MVLESPFRPPLVVGDAQDKKGVLHSQLRSNAHVSFEEGPPQPSIQEGGSSGKGVEDESTNGTFRTQSWGK